MPPIYIRLVAISRTDAAVSSTSSPFPTTPPLPSLPEAAPALPVPPYCLQPLLFILLIKSFRLVDVATQVFKPMLLTLSQLTTQSAEKFQRVRRDDVTLRH